MLLLPLSARLSLARGGMSGMRGGGLGGMRMRGGSRMKDFDPPPRYLTRPANPEPQEPLIIDRCRAQELSPGGALAILVVLATGSAVHMPGSLTIPRRSRLYRLVPELGLADTFNTVYLVMLGVFVHRKTLRRSVTAILTLRHSRPDSNFWWRKPVQDSTPNDGLNIRRSRQNTTPVVPYLSTPAPGPSLLPDPYYSAANDCFWRTHCRENTKPVLSRISRFGYERWLSNALMLLATIKALAARGIARTTLLAVSYALPFFTLELLSLAAVRVGSASSPTRAKQEDEAVACAELITLLDNSIDGREYRIRARLAAGLDTYVESIDPPWEPSMLHITLLILATLAYGLFAILHLFLWPFSIPRFLLFDFQEKHSANGRWVFAYLTSAVWLFWIGLAIACLSAILYAPYIFMRWTGAVSGRETNPYISMRAAVLVQRFWESRAEIAAVDAYTLLKVALIVRYYASGNMYTGEGTRKPEWLEWLG